MKQHNESHLTDSSACGTAGMCDVPPGFYEQEKSRLKFMISAQFAVRRRRARVRRVSALLSAAALLAGVVLAGMAIWNGNIGRVGTTSDAAQSQPLVARATSHDAHQTQAMAHDAVDACSAVDDYDYYSPDILMWLY